MTAEAVAEGGSGEEDTTVPVLTGGTGPVASRVFPGLPDQAGQARRWVRALASHLGGLDRDDMALVVAELFANAVLHTGSRGGGGKVAVAVTADGVVHVHDYGPAESCAGLAAGPETDSTRADCGRGLEIVAALCAGLVHMPAAWCLAVGPDDPASRAGGCCTCARLRPAAPGVAPLSGGGRS